MEKVTSRGSSSSEPFSVLGWNYKIKEGEVGKNCGANGTLTNVNLGRKFGRKSETILRNLDVHGRIISKWNAKKWAVM
jgi:hypothetical protein